MEVYFDNAATTRCEQAVVDTVTRIMLKDYGNPSSMHKKGMEAENIIKGAVKSLAEILKCKDKEIYFTSGGTESNNLAIIGTLKANSRNGKHIITSAIEHASVMNVFKALELEGYEVTYLPVDNKGVVSPACLKEALREDTALVSIMYVNNEIGSLEPVEELSKVIKNNNPKTAFHVDGIQAFGKYKINPQKQGIDLLSVSGHKLHGPKGTGILYIREGLKVCPIIYGGGQQKGLRSGTENVPGIAGLVRASEILYENFSQKQEKMYALKSYFTDEIMKLDGIFCNGPLKEEGAPHIVSVSFDGVRSEVLLHALEEKGIYVSAGSACSSNKPAVSATLKSIGVKNKWLDSTLRFSFSWHSTMEEVDYCMEVLQELLPILRKYARH